ncbi:MAG: amino acid ABC transporter permease [Gammaproteobacteria bacterium]|nr:amino acid ABC transporter permease [Gammaproteobacteria bacterium]
MRSRIRPIPGIVPSHPTRGTDLPVLKPFRVATYGHASDLKFCRWLEGLNPKSVLVVALIPLVWPIVVLAQGGFTTADATEALWRWLPFLVSHGFALNILISFFTMLIGTIAGILVGLGQVSPIRALSKFSWFITQLFRNSPWLVLLFIVMLAFPFEIEFAGHIFLIPDWIKAVFGLSLPIMANISEIVRGGIQSVPTGQWEAAESLAFTRRQTLWQIILPQCFKRMIPPWMNWYAILTMATPLVSLLGVEELVTLSRQAMEAEDNHPELLMPFFGFALVIFFLYCYPIAKWTVRLEQKFAIKT